MKKFIVITIFLLVSSAGFAQPVWCWAEDALGTGDNQFLDLTTDPVSGVSYAVGYYNNNLSSEFALGFNGTPDMSSTIGNQDGLVVKYDQFGNYIWAFKIGSVGDSIWITGVEIGAGGNIFITGYFNDRCDFDGTQGSSSQILTSAPGTNEDVFLAKYDSDGQFQWVRQGTNTGEAIASDIAVNGTNVYITGWFENSIQFDNGGGVVASNDGRDVFVVCYDQTLGNLQWESFAGDINVPVEDEFGWGIAADNNGVYVTGTYRRRIQFNGGPTLTASNLGITSSFIAEYNAFTGVINWVGDITSNAPCETRGIAVDVNNMYLVGGGDGNV